MKLIDKLKNALFEEEYVEVEEKPRKKENKKEKIKKEEIVKKEKPIAKKIVQPERKENVKENIEEEPELLDEDFEVKQDHDKSLKNEFKFPVMEDNDFKMEEQPKPKERPINSELNSTISKKKKNKEIKNSRSHKSKPYGLDEFELPESEHGLYEKKEERTYFKPSPIISPIYGILDKNYKKEEIRDKKEIRLTSSYAHENLDVDEVRKRAYGNLADDLEQEFKDSRRSVNIVDYGDLEEDEDVSLLDLSEENDTPEVKKVTVGDAEEYFEDLGLEYNVDYKDTSKEKATGRRVQKDSISEDSSQASVAIKDEEVQKEDIDTHKNMQEEDDDDDNLFDLIDSMYDKD